MTRRCLSVARREDLKSPAVETVDILELRLDRLEGMPDEIPELPFIATLGDVAEGDRPALVREALVRGAFMVDVGSDDSGIDITDDRLIMSVHDWERTPDAQAMTDVLQSLRGMPKGAFMVNHLADLVSLHRAAGNIQGRRVLIGMGELGVLSRIRPGALKSEFTYVHAGTPTAVGQLSANDATALGDDPMVLGIIGRPLSHSASPAMHKAALAAAQIHGTYLRLDVPEIDGLPDVLRGYDIRGLNVTIPYKVSVIGLLDRLDNTAEAVGAVNTICNEGGELVGYNTDVIGISEALKGSGFKIAGSQALVIGAGGAAMACCHALTSSGANLTVTNRDTVNGERLAQRFSARFESTVADLSAFQLIVNCTPLGMEGFPSRSPVDLDTIGEGHTVFDLVYRPRETPLVREAAAKGAATIEGLEMLVHQARASFRIWTGADMDADVFREAAL